MCDRIALARSRVAAVLSLVALLTLLQLSIAPPARADDRALVLFAAASTKNALDELIRQFRCESSRPPVASYAASSVLARQVVAGAPADLIITADEQWMNYLIESNAVDPHSRINVAANRLALIARPGYQVPADLLPLRTAMPLAQALGPHDRLAIADPRHVPAGRYARAALQSFDLWASVSGRLAPAANVRHALALVLRGESPLGIVYASDLSAAARAGAAAVKLVAYFPTASHPPIRYPAALVRQGSLTARPCAVSMMQFLASPQATGVFRRFGFSERDDER